MECSLLQLSSSVVLNLGSIEPQGFGESVSWVRRQEILSNESRKNKIHNTHFIFATTKGSMNAYMEHVGFSNSNKVNGITTGIRDDSVKGTTL